MYTIKNRLFVFANITYLFVVVFIILVSASWAQTHDENKQKLYIEEYHAIKIGLRQSGNGRNNINTGNQFLPEKAISNVEDYICEPVETANISINEDEHEICATETGYEEIETHDDTYIGTFVLTAYCSCYDCCGSYAENRPVDEYGSTIVYTASGEIAKPNHTIAVDTSVIPYGTEVEINGNIYVAEDCGGGINGNHIDVYFDNHDEALAFGRQSADVYLVG